MMTSSREGQSDFLDKIVASLANEGMDKTASIDSSNHPASKAKHDEQAVAAKSAGMNSNHPASKVAVENKTASDSVADKAAVADKMTLHQVRIARRGGQFVKVANKLNLYQDVKTNDFWKISEDKQYAVRTFVEDDNLAVEKV